MRLISSLLFASLLLPACFQDASVAQEKGNQLQSGGSSGSSGQSGSAGSAGGEVAGTGGSTTAGTGGTASGGSGGQPAEVCTDVGTWEISPTSKGGTGKERVKIARIGGTPRVFFLDRSIPENQCNGAGGASKGEASGAASQGSGVCSLQVQWSESHCFSGEDQCLTQDYALQFAGDHFAGTAKKVSGACAFDGSEETWEVTAKRLPDGNPGNIKDRPVPEEGCLSGVACTSNCSVQASPSGPGMPNGFSSIFCDCKGGVLDCEVTTPSPRCTSGAACSGGQTCTISVGDEVTQSGRTADCACAEGGKMECWVSDQYDPSATIKGGHACLAEDTVMATMPDAEGCYEQCACPSEVYQCGQVCP